MGLKSETLARQLKQKKLTDVMSANKRVKQGLPYLLKSKAILNLR